MKISALLHRRLHWINLPGAILMLLLQRMPVVNAVAVAEEMVVSSPVGAVLKSVVAAVAALGAVNSMAGATPLTASGGGSSATGVTVTSGVAMATVSFSVGSEANAPDPTHSWNIGIAAGSSFPPGLNFSGQTGEGEVTVTVLQLRGTPTTAGTYHVTLQAISTSGTYMSATFPYTITVTGPANVAPSITTQPSSQTIVSGNAVTFTSGASGTPTPTFQWQKDSVNINGATAATYMIASVSPGDAGTYKLVATNTAGTVTSNGAVLTVNVAPQITLQPSNQTVTAGNSVTFTASASGTPAPTYQWQKNSVNISGATSSSYMIASVAAGDAGTYKVIATNSVSAATSNGAVLTVNPAAIAPSFSLQPVSQTIWAGRPVIFTVAAGGTPAPTYQWQRQPWGGVAANLSDGANFAGTTSAALTISGITTAMNGDKYTCIASNTAGPVTSNAATLTVNPAAYDFNGDGQSDLLWQNSSTGERVIWLMNGNGYWSSASLGTVAGDWSVAAVADFSGDSQVDLLWQNSVTGERLIWLMNGTTVGSSVSLGVVPVEWSIACAADFDGDGKADIVWQNTTTGERIVWFMNGTAFSSSASLGVVPTEWSIAGTGDFNGDGHADLVWTNTRTGELNLWEMNGTAFLASVSLGVVSPQLQVAGVGDYNNDGWPDLLWTDTLTGDRSVWLMNGPAFGSTVALTTLPLEWVLDRPYPRHVAADFNGDANSDLVWQNTATGERIIWLMNGTNFASGASVGVVPPEWWIAATGDFNGDGKTDLVWQNASTGERVIWLMDGTSFLSSASLGVISTDWWIVGAADFNGDGKPDLLWQNNATGERVVWFMDGPAFASSGSLGIIPTEWSIAGTGDFNGDGKPDILWQDTATGERLVWLMDGTNYSSSAPLGVVPVEWSIAGSGDFNADGHDDIVWQNTATGERAIWLMSGTAYAGGASLGVVPVQWSIRN
jgi:hypothetical protein